MIHGKLSYQNIEKFEKIKTKYIEKVIRSVKYYNNSVNFSNYFSFETFSYLSAISFSYYLSF